MMKGTGVALVFLISASAIASVNAENLNTLSLGYASNDFLTSSGVNIKYLYENTAFPLGWMGSFTTTWKKRDAPAYEPDRFNYYSLTTGPVIALPGDLVKLYAQGGISTARLSYRQVDYKSDSYGLTWGIGAQIAVTKNVVFDAGFEQSSLGVRKRYNKNDQHTRMNIWTAGIGYRF